MFVGGISFGRLFEALVDQADLFGLVAIQGPSSVDELFRLGNADNSGKTLSASSSRYDGSLSLNQAQLDIGS